MKNDIIQLEITDITPEGFGVGRSGGKVVFVPDTAIGDFIEAKILKELKNHSFAKAESIITPSADRVASDCEVSAKCGGCVFRHISYNAEQKLKKSFVSGALSRIGGLEIPVGETVFGFEHEYRNKVQYPFAPDANGKCIFGYYARRSHRIVEHKKCPLQDKIFTDIAAFCAETANRLGIKAYDEAGGKGILRHLVMRKNRRGELLLCLVVAENTKTLEKLASAVKERFFEVIGIHININKRRDNVIFGEKTFCLFGKETLTDTLCGKSFELSPRAFYQVNAEMAEKLYNKAASYIPKKEEGSVILDLYCGAGTIGLCVAGGNDKLCGVEIIEDAVVNARKNAKLNQRSKENTLFVCGDASVGVKKCRERFGNPEIIIVDPPRKGLDIEVINTVVSASPERVIYISCDPATLARDCAELEKRGYKAQEATPFDLFPRTGHVESVVCLSREKADDYVRISVHTKDLKASQEQ
ncbi:MAG: 23S rRNA (uracil(1939)-C(5))-methyltransferase RlmD [Clostridia bacterium]|nr:23S rRNA (uracil(1939)-C(5))-methyltransferase RlmD [Clostridia bacterium]